MNRADDNANIPPMHPKVPLDKVVLAPVIAADLTFVPTPDKPAILVSLASADALVAAPAQVPTLAPVRVAITAPTQPPLPIILLEPGLGTGQEDISPLMQSLFGLRRTL